MVNEIHSPTGTHLNTLISDNDKEGGGQGLDRKTAYEREGKSNSVSNLRSWSVANPCNPYCG